jgi:hypothetical protein
MVTTAIPWMILDTEQLDMGIAEVAGATNLSALTDVRVCVIGC